MKISASAERSGAVPSLKSFKGVWSITRDIRDRLANVDLRFEGTGRFDPAAGGLLYSEFGELLLPQGGRIRAERGYIFFEDEAGIAVFFHDGRPFHRISRGSDRPDAMHWCDPDRYSVSYDFAQWPDWTATWNVSGPRKDYSMVTRYSRG